MWRPAKGPATFATCDIRLMPTYLALCRGKLEWFERPDFFHQDAGEFLEARARNDFDMIDGGHRCADFASAVANHGSDAEGVLNYALIDAIAHVACILDGLEDRRGGGGVNAAGGRSVDRPPAGVG